MLINESSLKKVPRLYAQEEKDDPKIYARLSTQDESWTCYIAEAGQKNGAYQVFALFVSKTYGYNWAQLPLAQVEKDLKDAGLEAHLDEHFHPQRVSKLTGIKRRDNKLPVQLKTVG